MSCKITHSEEENYAHFIFILCLSLSLARKQFHKFLEEKGTEA